MTNTRIRISALLLAISGLLTPHPAAFGAGKAPKIHELTFSGKATPGQYYVPVYTSFTVPEGIVKISVTQHLGSGEARPGNLDLGIFDERGAGFEGPGFRGWSGGARRSFEIGETEATPGYLAGRINPGRWTVIQMPTTAGRTTDWTLKITLTEGPRAKKLPAPSYAAPQLNDKPGWYRIAPHVHTVHSDGRLTPAEVIALGKASGLDGIVSTDHNTTSALLHWGEIQDPEFLVINGVEVTYGQGHWNIFGLDPHAWIDFRIHHNDTLRYRKAVAKARKAGRLLVANHPYNLDFLYDVTPMDGIEVWNSAWSPANERAVELWHTLLVGGNRKFAVASTDFHRGGNIASPHTVVRAEALSAEAVIDAIAAGRSYVARDASVEIGMQVRNSATPVQHADIGDTLLRSGGMQAEFRSNTAGRLRMTDQQGWFSDTSIAPGTVVVSIPERSLWVRAELRAEDGSMIALTNPIYIQHPLTTQSLLPE